MVLSSFLKSEFIYNVLSMLFLFLMTALTSTITLNTLKSQIILNL